MQGFNPSTWEAETEADRKAMVGRCLWVEAGQASIRSSGKGCMKRLPHTNRNNLPHTHYLKLEVVYSDSLASWALLSGSGLQAFLPWAKLRSVLRTRLSSHLLALAKRYKEPSTSKPTQASVCTFVLFALMSLANTPHMAKPRVKGKESKLVAKSNVSGPGK